MNEREDLRPGPTGAYPRGSIAPDDNGELTVMMYPEHGLIRIEFGTPVRWVALEPDEAREMALNLLKQAAELDGRGPVLMFRPGSQAVDLDGSSDG